MVRIAEVSGQTRDREQQPPAGQRRKRSGAKQSPESEEADLLALGADASEEEPTEPDAASAAEDTGGPEADPGAPPPNAGTIDLLA